ncbi:MAG: hypothetical protein WAM58_07170 [Candidatus Acidiferrum sp.]
MPAYFRIDKERRLVMTTFSGVFTAADGLSHQEKLLKDPVFHPSFSELLDCTHITKADLAPDDVRRLAQRTIFAPNARRAILVSGDYIFGLAKMFAVFRELAGEKGIRVFDNLDEALWWVFSGNVNS